MSTSENRDHFVSIGPDWYNIYRYKDDQLRIEPCPGVYTYYRSVVEGTRKVTYTDMGYVSLLRGGRMNLASVDPQYVGTYNMPRLADQDVIDSLKESLDRLSDNGSFIV